MRAVYGVVAFAVVSITAPAGQAADKPDWYEKAVKKVEATFEPAEAKPGETVTLKITVHLHDGYHTYPTRQPDKAAEAMVNKISFPDAGAVTFVGDVTDPKEYKTKAEPELGIKEMRIVEGKVVYERKAVVSATAKPGAVTVKLTAVTLNVCDAVNCYPAKKLTPEATLKVLDGGK